MKETKFRAWDKVNKRWIGRSYLEYLCVCDDVVVLVKYKPNSNGGYSPGSVRQLTHPEVSNLEIVQCTGFKDNKAKEIFEGDTTKEGELLLVVEWCYTRGAWMLVDRTTNDRYCFLSDMGSEETEIIGNIYEN